MLFPYNLVPRYELSSHMFLFCFYSWSYILNNISSIVIFNIFGMTIHVFLNLFRKIYPPFVQIFITCLICSRAFFSPPLKVKRRVGNNADKCIKFLTGSLKLFYLQIDIPIPYCLLFERKKH